VLDGTAGPERVSLVKSGPGQSAYQVHDEYVTAATVYYLNRLGVKKKSDGKLDPFSLTVGFMLPHPPYVAREEDYAAYADQITMPKKPAPFDQVKHPFLRAWREHTGIVEASDAEILRSRAAYWGLVQRVDIMVGEILQALEANGLADNTLIVYTSDHGDMQGEHGLWWKHVFYEESVKVPLIVSWPGVIPGGQRSERVVSALDVNATMLDALGAPPLPNSPGRSFLGLISEARVTPDWEDVAFAEYCADEYVPFKIDTGKTYQRMIRQNEWKLVYYHGLEPQLFNLADDPGELVDRAQDPACQAVRNELLARLLADWNPEVIAATMAAKRGDNAVLRAWARQTNPPDQHRWDLRPEMNYLNNLA
jgi:choline-sulfatase